MSFRGSPTRKLIKRIFPFTGFGLLYLVLALGVLAAGILRMELATLLWGSAFLLLACYCLGTNHLTRSILHRHLGKTPDPVDCTLTTAGLFPGTAGSAEIKADVPRRTVPGVQLGFEISLQWPGRHPLVLRAALSGGRNRKTVGFSPAYRGCYTSGEARIVVQDLLGFTRSAVSVVLEEKLRVYPSIEPGGPARLPSLEGGEEQERRRAKHRSEELLEVRKYFPGDDIRKLHWKVFAHTAELFMRIGEETPPPRSRFLVLLDASPSPWVPESLSADYLDGLVEACASAVLELAARGFKVLFTACHLGSPRMVSPEKGRELLGLLAEVWWTDRYSLELPRQQQRQVLLYSSPESANLPRLLGELESRGWEVRLFLKDLPRVESKVASRAVRELFLRPASKPAAPRAQAAEAQLRAFREALSREIGRRSSKGSRKVPVETI
jgi:uncharacterized protein (DUF58 family)